MTSPNARKTALPTPPLHTLWDFDLIPGEVYEREELHAQLDAPRTGRISRSKTHNVALLFTDQDSAPYLDGWCGEQSFYYVGDDTKRQPLLAGRNAARDNLRLLLFKVHGKHVIYAGEFTTTNDPGYVTVDTLDSGRKGAPMRTSLVFRLRPVDARTSRQVLLHDSSLLPTGRVSRPLISVLPIENAASEPCQANPRLRLSDQERQERKMALNYASYLKELGRSVVRHRVILPDDPVPLLTRLYTTTTDTLTETRCDATREAVRSAIGQLLDLKRIFTTAKLELLLPVTPRPDLMELLHSQGITVVWPEDRSYKTAHPNLPTEERK